MESLPESHENHTASETRVLVPVLRPRRAFGEARERVRQLVHEEPGIGLPEVKRRLQLCESLARYHVTELETRGLVVVHRGRTRRLSLWPPGTKPSDEYVPRPPPTVDTGSVRPLALIQSALKEAATKRWSCPHMNCGLPLFKRTINPALVEWACGQRHRFTEQQEAPA